MEDRKPRSTEARLRTEFAEERQLKLLSEQTYLLQEIVKKLHFANVKPTKSLRRMIMEWLFAGGALLAVAGTSLDYLSDQQSADTSKYIAACARADEAIRDETLSLSLTESEKQAYNTRKLLISQKCDIEAGL